MLKIIFIARICLSKVHQSNAFPFILTILDYTITNGAFIFYFSRSSSIWHPLLASWYPRSRRLTSSLCGFLAGNTDRERREQVHRRPDQVRGPLLPLDVRLRRQQRVPDAVRHRLGLNFVQIRRDAAGFC